jgi:NADH-quinone oxidoreductase subunit C
MFVVDNNIVEILKNKLQQQFGSDVSSFEVIKDMPTFTITKNRIVELLRFLNKDKELQFQFLTTLCGMHFPDSDQQFGVVYHLHSFKNNLRIRIKSFTSGNNPEFPTATGIFKAANWMEREAYDFFGIKFSCHPNLKRILNMEDIDFFPLRKEFPLEDQKREDKNDKMFGR